MQEIRNADCLKQKRYLPTKVAFSIVMKYFGYTLGMTNVGMVYDDSTVLFEPITCIHILEKRSRLALWLVMSTT